MSQLLRLVIPTTPRPEVRPNAAYGVKPWQHAKAREEKARLKRITKEEAASFLNRGTRAAGFTPFPDDARVEITVFWEKVRTPRYANGRHRPRVDTDALPLMCKGILDGITDAGVWQDDRNLAVAYAQGKAEPFIGEEGEPQFYEGTTEFTGWTVIIIRSPEP